MGYLEHPALRSYWYPVAESVDLTTDSVAVTLLGDDYVLWRATDGAVVAAPDRCLRAMLHRNSVSPKRSFRSAQV